MIVMVGPCGREVAEAQLGWAGDPVARGPVLVVAGALVSPRGAACAL